MPLRPVVCIDCGAEFETGAHNRRQCDTCRPKTVTPERTAVCVDCGETFEKGTNPRERCDPCRAAHARRLARETARRLAKKSCLDCGAPIDFSPDGGRRPDRCPEHREENLRLIKARQVKSHRLRKHGIDEATYLELLARQGGRCAICRSDTPGIAGQSWHIDHDHTCCPGKKSCGKCVRGVLCAHCNIGVGHLRNDPKILKAAIAYLERDIVRQILNSPNRDEDGNLIPE